MNNDVSYMVVRGKDEVLRVNNSIVYATRCTIYGNNNRIYGHGHNEIRGSNNVVMQGRENVVMAGVNNSWRKGLVVPKEEYTGMRDFGTLAAAQVEYYRNVLLEDDFLEHYGSSDDDGVGMRSFLFMQSLNEFLNQKYSLPAPPPPFNCQLFEPCLPHETQPWVVCDSTDE